MTKERKRNNNTAIRVHLDWKNDVEFYGIHDRIGLATFRLL